MNKHLWFLALLGAALLSIAVLDPWASPVGPKKTRLVGADLIGRLSSIRLLDASGIREIRREQGGDWTIAGSASGRVEPDSVQRLLSALGMLEVVREDRSQPKNRWQSTPTSIELIKDDGTSERFEVGTRSADGRYQRLRHHLSSSNQDQVLWVEAYVVADVFEESNRLRSRRLVPWSVRGRDAIRLDCDDHERLEADATTVSWHIDGNIVSAATDEGRLSQWLQQLDSLRFLQFRDGACESPSRSELRWEQGSQQVMIRECGHCEDGSVFLAVGESRGCVSASAWELLRSVAEDPSQLVTRTLLPSQRGNSVTRVCGTERVELTAADVDRGRLAQWWSTVNQSVRGFLPVSPLAPICVFRGESWSVAIGTRAGKWVAHVAGESVHRELDSDIAALLQVNATHFRSPVLISEEALFASRIEIRERLNTWEFVRGDSFDDWTSTDAEFSPKKAGRLAMELATTLAGLSADGFGSQLSPTQREDDARDIHIEFESAVANATRGYHLRVWDDPDGCQVQVNHEIVADVQPEICEVLLASWE